MDLDKFLKSQTFKTGTFVLIVLFVFLIIFKLGVVHGYKKASFSYKYGFNSHRVIGAKFFGHQKGAFNKEMLKNFSSKEHLIKIKAILDSVEESESVTEEVVEEE